MIGHGVLLTLAEGGTIKTPYIWPWGTFDPGRRRYIQPMWVCSLNSTRSTFQCGVQAKKQSWPKGRILGQQACQVTRVNIFKTLRFNGMETDG